MRTLTAAVFAASCFALAAADDPKPAVPPGKVDWGNYVDHTRVAGEVEKVTDAGLTLKVSKLVPQGRNKPKVVTEDIDFQYHDNALIRWSTRPPKLDLKGKKVPYTDKELKEIKAPAGSPGFAADKSDLTKGSKVELQLMRPKGTALDKLVSTDFKIKYVMINDAPAAYTGLKPAEKDDKKDPKKDDKKKP